MANKLQYNVHYTASILSGGGNIQILYMSKDSNTTLSKYSITSTSKNITSKNTSPPQMKQL